MLKKKKNFLLTFSILSVDKTCRSTSLPKCALKREFCRWTDKSLPGSLLCILLFISKRTLAFLQNSISLLGVYHNTSKERCISRQVFHPVTAELFSSKYAKTTDFHFVEGLTPSLKSLLEFVPVIRKCRTRRENKHWGTNITPPLRQDSTLWKNMCNYREPSHYKQ